MGMLTATVTGPDLAEVLGPVTGRGPVIDALIDGLGPVVVGLLQVGIGLGGRAAAGTRRGFHVPHAQESTGVGALFIPGRWCSPGWTPFTSRHPPPSLAASPVPR